MRRAAQRVSRRAGRGTASLRDAVTRKGKGEQGDRRAIRRARSRRDESRQDVVRPQTQEGKLSLLERVVSCINKRSKLLEVALHKEMGLYPPQSATTCKSEPPEYGRHGEEKAESEGNVAGGMEQARAAEESTPSPIAENAVALHPMHWETAEKVAVAYDRLGLSPDQSTTGSRSERLFQQSHWVPGAHRLGCLGKPRAGILPSGRNAPSAKSHAALQPMHCVRGAAMPMRLASLGAAYEAPQGVRGPPCRPPSIGYTDAFPMV